MPLEKPDHSTLDLTIDQLVQRWPQLAHSIINHHMACIGCDFDRFHSLRAALEVYEIDATEFLASCMDSH